MATRVANEPLAEVMDRFAVEADPALCWTEGDRLRCVACGHRCLIGEGLRGICKVRVNEGGRLLVPHGYVAGLQSDPVEKKPFFHVYPGSDALTFGMLGCDLHCSYCQNWVTSQALRDPQAAAPIRPISAAQLIDVARREGSRLVVSSYNEPLITAEWAVSVFKEAKKAGLACAFVSNGNATPEVLDFLRPWIVAYKVDLKSFQDRNYRSLGGTLENITRTIEMIHERGIWLEVVTLIIPGFNDSEEELRQAARFLASVSRDIPWHVTAFHKDYRMTDPDATSAQTLMRAAEIGTEEGLRFVYAGNLPGRVGQWENTRCPSCQATVIERYGYLIQSYRVTEKGRCPDCQTQLPGVWPGSSNEVRTGNTLAAYQSRLPRRVQTLDVIEVPPQEPSNQERGGKPPMTTQATTGTSQNGFGLTAEQKQQVLEVAARMLRSQVRGEALAFPGGWQTVGNQKVAGAFVSLKRGKHLRSCCGLLGQTLPLHQALEHAASRTAWEDARFPPISPTEIDHLHMEVWLLAGPQIVPLRGEERLQAITIGKHGVQVVQGQAHGLFLPSVAVESGWDARKLLDQVCIKAGLAPTAWKEEATTLFTFEGEALRTPLGPSPTQVAPSRPTPFFQGRHLEVYADFCRQNVVALLTGSTPSFYLSGAPDGNVSGVILLVQQSGKTEVLQFSQLSLRPGVPLQATLSALAQTAAQSLARQGIRLEGIYGLRMDLLILHDPVLHGTVADPHVDEVDARHRAALVLERSKAGLHFDPAQTVAELVTAAARQAQVAHPPAASLFSLEAHGTRAPISLSTAPKPVRGPAVRQPAMAGTFYEGDAASLAHTIDQLLAASRAEGRRPYPAAMVPHAGLKYSGRIAAGVLQRIEIPKTVIVLGPKHTNLGMDWAVAPHQTWALPGGSVESDFKLARKLCQAIPGLEMDAAAHQREHAIEVELPFLAKLAPEARVVGIAIGHGDLEGCLRFARGLADLMNSLVEKPLLLISSDMNHFANDAETRRLDALALDALASGDPVRLYETVTGNQISMCGVLPAVIVLETLRLLKIPFKAERAGYATTADVTGDPSKVVGYAGMLLGG